MTGRYLIYTPLDSRPPGSRQNDPRFAANWSKFVALCRSLHRDGLHYDVQFNLSGADPHVLVTASGTAKPYKRAVVHRRPLPAAVSAQCCRERILQIECFLPENLGRRNNQTSYWRTRQARYHELSRMPEERLRAELEYWLELERLSALRARPGRCDDAFGADEELAA
jgi:hypothetical protein